jgi:hypothetical protein
MKGDEAKGSVISEPCSQPECVSRFIELCFITLHRSVSAQDGPNGSEIHTAF